MGVDLSSLNPEQRAAVCATEGPVLVQAGAGSGKTRVLTHRIAYLIDSQKARPAEILAITFTNRAAKEMKTRLEELLGSETKSWVMTFHSACGRILRREAQTVGLSPNYTIYDADDSLRLIREVLKALSIDRKYLPETRARAEISSAKNRLLTPAKLEASLGGDDGGLIRRIWKEYDRRLRAANALDFDDMLYLTVRVLEKDPEALHYWQGRFKYILVDEYQDTNTAQARVLKLLGEIHGNVFAVGDPLQAIFGFRDADVRNILEFERNFPSAQIFALEQNYRSTNRILKVANCVIANNLEQGPKRLKLWSNLGEGQVVQVLKVKDERAEASFVVRDVSRLLDLGASLSEIAILYRINAQSRPFEEVLMTYGIPYRLVGGPRFYERAEVKDAIAYLRAINNPADNIAIVRASQMPKRGLGLASLEKIAIFSRQEYIPLGMALARAEEAGVSGKSLLGAQKLYKMFTRLAKLKDEPIGSLLEATLKDSGYIAALEAEGTFEARGRLENLEELVQSAYEYDRRSEGAGGLSDFLQEIALYSDQDKLIEGEGALTLMTIHNAKGLEYPSIYLVGLEEGIFPHSLAIRNGEIEEERRLFYVAITRAKENLTITYADSRFLFGEVRRELPSRFLSEMQTTKSERVSSSEAASSPPLSRTFSKKTKPAKQTLASVSVGDSVRHLKFGEGIVVSVHPDKSATIMFVNGGKRRLMLQYAPLEKIND